MSQEQSKVSNELKQAAKKIEDAARECYCYSMIHTIVQNACDHILAVARTIELRDKLEKTEEQLLRVIDRMEKKGK